MGTSGSGAEFLGSRWQRVQEFLKKVLTCRLQSEKFAAHTETTTATNNMRTNTLLLAAAALAGGVLASSAQVYSANVVGYVNTTFDLGATLVCNPLKATTNDLNTIIGSAPDGIFVTTFDSTTGDFSAMSPTFYANNGVSGPGVWDPNLTINPGQGFFVTTSVKFTNTFVGDVMQGANMPLAIPAGFSLLGSLVPVGGNVTNVMAQIPLGDNGSFVQTYSNSAGDIGATSTYYGAGVWDPEIAIAVGEGFYMFNGGAATTWLRSFTVQ